MAFTSAVLTRLEAGFGHDEACRRYAAETLEASIPLGIHHLTAWAHSGLGLLELGAGRYTAAAAHFDEVAALATQIGEPGFLWWHGDAIEAYLGCGRTADAQDLLDRLNDIVETTQRPWARAVAERCAALMALTVDAAWAVVHARCARWTKPTTPPPTIRATACPARWTASPTWTPRSRRPARCSPRVSGASQPGDRRGGATDVARA